MSKELRWITTDDFPYPDDDDEAVSDEEEVDAVEVNKHTHDRNDSITVMVIGNQVCEVCGQKGPVLGTRNTTITESFYTRTCERCIVSAFVLFRAEQSSVCNSDDVSSSEEPELETELGEEAEEPPAKKSKN